MMGALLSIARKAAVSSESPTPEKTKASPDPARSRQTSAVTIDREAFEERAAIREFDGGLSREDAERLALVDLADDRIHCTDCAHLRGRVCAQAAMLGASQGYTPVLSIARRCEQFRPEAGDPDQRTGAQRWPSLLIERHGTVH